MLAVLGEKGLGMVEFKPRADLSSELGALHVLMSFVCSHQAHPSFLCASCIMVEFRYCDLCCCRGTMRSFVAVVLCTPAVISIALTPAYLLLHPPRYLVIVIENCIC